MKKIKPAPKQYMEDSRWANENFTEIVKQYPDLYVGIYKKKVIASGKTIAEVEEEGFKKTGIDEFPIRLAEKTTRISLVMTAGFISNENFFAFLRHLRYN